MKGVLILSGYNDRGVVSFCRFCQKNDIPVFIVAANESDLILSTDYKRNVICVRDNRVLCIEDFNQYQEIVSAQSPVSELVVLPSTEFLNRFLLINRDGLEKMGFIIPLCSAELYCQISDKYSFGQLCKESNIKVPAEYPQISLSLIPFVAKPRSYFADSMAISSKPVIVQTEGDYYGLQEIDNQSFYYQQYIGGDSYYLLYYFSADAHVSVYSQQNFIQQHNGRSIIAAQSSTIHHDPVAKQFGDLLIGLGFVGLVMIELRQYRHEFYMIEANPRLWGPSQLILDSGMDLFGRLAFDNGLVKHVPKCDYQTGIRYFWSGGLVEDQQAGYESARYNYDKSAFFDEFVKWTKSDIYLRPDTQSVFFDQLSRG